MRRDLRLFFADRRAIVMSFLAPIIIGSFFGFIFGGQRGKTENSRIPILTIDEDKSAISREIVSRLTADKSLDVKPSTVDEARATVRKGKAVVAVSIPKDFGVNSGRAFFSSAGKPEVGIMYDPSHSAELGMVRGILTGHVMQVVSKEMFGGQTGRDLVKEILPQVEQSDRMPPAYRKTLRDLLQSVDKLNQQQASETGANQGGLSTV